MGCDTKACPVRCATPLCEHCANLKIEALNAEIARLNEAISELRYQVEWRSLHGATAPDFYQTQRQDALTWKRKYERKMREVAHVKVQLAQRRLLEPIV